MQQAPPIGWLNEYKQMDVFLPSSLLFEQLYSMFLSLQNYHRNNSNQNVFPPLPSCSEKHLMKGSS